MALVLPPAFVAALAQPGSRALYWIEIEGLPYAYGTRAQAGSWWGSLPAGERFLELRPYLPRVPAGVDARLDPLEGLAEPGEFQFEVVDADGFLTQAANVGREESDTDALYLTATANAGDATLNVGGNLAAWPSSGYAYLGRSTVSYTGKGTGTLTGVTWGCFRSPSFEHAAGEPVTPYPQHLGLRLCWFYLALTTGETWSVADRVTRYVGQIEDYSLAGAATWSLTARSPEKAFAGATLFRSLRSGTLKSSLPGPAGVYEKEGEGDPGVLTNLDTGAVELELRLTDYGDGRAFTADEWIHLRIEDEIVKAQWNATAQRFGSVYRGLFGTAVAQHAAGVEWREGVPLLGQETDGPPEAVHSPFTAGGSPEEIILQLLCGSGTYGVLPEGWHAGIDPSTVDVESFTRIRDAVHAGDKPAGWIDEPVTFRDLVAAHLLQPWGLYLVYTATNTIWCGYLRQAAPAATAATIDRTNTVGQPRWKGGTDGTVGGYRLACDLDILGGLAGEPATRLVDIFTDTRRLYSKEKARTVEHASLFAAYASGLADPVGVRRRAGRLYDSRRAFFSAQYGKPPAVLSVRTLYSLAHVRPGDYVTVSFAEIPSASGSGRGYTGPAFVQSTRPDDSTWTIGMELLLLGAQVNRYAFIAPSARVASAGASTVTVEANAYSLAPVADAARFAVGDAITFVSPNFATVVGPATITAISGNTITAGTPSGSGVSAGWFVVPADYDSLTASQKAGKQAAMAGSTETLGASAAPSHRYTGF